jgi:RNA polymerase sigma-70 factor (ECF subfamily)
LNNQATSGVDRSSVTALQKDRSAAFEAEALDHLRAIETLSRRLARNRTDADDLVQDAYLHALRSSGRFTPGTNLRAWLRTIVTNLAKNRWRDHARARVRADERVLAHAAVTHASSDASPEQRLLSDLIGPRLQASLESMPKALRDAVWLRDVEDLSYSEIARRLRVPIGTVMSRISRGRRLLHDRLVALETRAPAESEVGR